MWLVSGVISLTSHMCVEDICKHSDAIFWKCLDRVYYEEDGRSSKCNFNIIVEAHCCCGTSLNFIAYTYFVRVLHEACKHIIYI